MARKKSSTPEPTFDQKRLPALSARRRRVLILPRYLAEEADRAIYRGQSADRAREIMHKWADLERDGHLRRKETSLDANFLIEIFGQALEYQTPTDSPEQYHLERNFTVPGIGTADGALGQFSTGATPSPAVVIELKGAETDLDRDRFNGRTPVQQCWEYLNGVPECTWGIVSNYATIRLYHRNKTQLAYEEFTLKEMRNESRFRQFFCLLSRRSLITRINGTPPLAIRLLDQTDNRQREVGDELYKYYNDNRLRLLEHLEAAHGKSREQSIHIAQKLIDRIVFVAFCEDRGLIPEKSIEKTHSIIPTFTKATNPRWQNFMGLFTAMDKGHVQHLILGQGFNGGLFREDEEVDYLQLNDEWTNFFKHISEYDFRDEVNVDVLGHLFERSVADVERLRYAPLFPPAKEAIADHAKARADEHPQMQKSRERKTLGTYYTPPEFTKFLVDQTVAAIINERFAKLREEHKLTERDTHPEKSNPAAHAYWRACWDALRELKICDPACGSGAFLIQAYDTLEARYDEVAEQIVAYEGYQADSLAAQIPDLIITDNLFGVDLSEQAVEITQLALWLRTARKGRTLADLSQNILRGNSLVTDRNADPHALVWNEAFPAIFGRKDNPGFDCVIGNPPWERLKLQEREFFAMSAPHIAAAVSAAQRRQLIAELEQSDPGFFARYTEAKSATDRTLTHVRDTGNFPLTAKGDLNTYMLFAELARKIVAPRGRVGLLVPSGIATDATTKEFFNVLMESRSLLTLFDFENKAPFFPDVHRSFKFCTLVFGGGDMAVAEADFAFFLRSMEDLKDKNRKIRLSLKDLKLLNPNTRTCPIFRTRRDAELTKTVYRNVPILIDHCRQEGGNPWGLKFVTMFHQTNDAELFHDPKELKKQGFKLDGNVWKKGKRSFLPLYEAKMVQAYDHRAASVIVDRGNWMRQGQTERTTLVSHQNPEYTVLPRWWIAAEKADEALGGEIRPAYVCFKDVTSPTNQRTMIGAFIPHVAVVNSAPLVLTDKDVSPRQQCCLLANLNSFALDFMARQKVGNVHLNFFIVEQLPILPPDRYSDRCPWQKRQTLEKWISDRVLKLTCTANDMTPMAEAAGFDPPVHKWKTEERAEIMAELDAAYFLLYGISREDAEYILSTFSGTDEADESTPSMFRSDNLILSAYDRLVHASKYSRLRR